MKHRFSLSDLRRLQETPATTDARDPRWRLDGARTQPSYATRLPDVLPDQPKPQRPHRDREDRS